MQRGKPEAEPPWWDCLHRPVGHELRRRQRKRKRGNRRMKRKSRKKEKKTKKRGKREEDAKKWHGSGHSEIG